MYDRIDDFLNAHVGVSDPALEAALASSRAAGLPDIQVAPNQGKLLHLWARSMNAKRILEIGTLGGYSTMWLARALPKDGSLITLEINPKHAEVARKNVEGLPVEIRLGVALEILPTLEGPFDFIFVDADKENLKEYVEHAIRLSRKGTIIAVDNVVRKGAIIEEGGDSKVAGTKRMFDWIQNETRIVATAIQIVGKKGHDGILFALVT
jgi:predicted O-methyltransferase YrrM